MDGRWRKEEGCGAGLVLTQRREDAKTLRSEAGGSGIAAGRRSKSLKVSKSSEGRGATVHAFGLGLKRGYRGREDELA